MSFKETMKVIIPGSETKMIKICVGCKRKLEGIIFQAGTYYCAHSSCDRYGLVSVVYNQKEES